VSCTVAHFLLFILPETVLIFVSFSGLGGFGRNKGILGFLGGAVACVPMNFRILSIAKFGHPVSSSALWFASFALGFAGAFADLAVPTPALVLPKRVLGVRVPPFHLDDNVVVPIVSGYACKHVFQVLKWSSDLALAKYLVV
jgi:dolichol kinase